MISAPLLIAGGLGALVLAGGLWLGSAAPVAKRGESFFSSIMIIAGGFTFGIRLIIQLVRLI